ncbi:ABC transporter ATP-binding protein [Defluviimonas sp. WL0024]|uniref:ABC transporter ATP-binding protein n=1 Tax=Albidovulum salinarum TaxID=2984153 RepID=A0ABT2X7Z4_9RHOB|nr:ABC transporter ATP-binding protein [Defluviimonas sp. WL0024]MCU9850066.1 ABC transporter ATP-binding protein [Defluviimonas sp. WL0024]
MTALKLENVNKSFGSVHVLKDINLTVEEGEFVVFVGPSGCGKSTLLRVIAGLEDATSGTITIGNEVVNTVPPAKRGIAMVFQSYALYPHLTVKDNMALGLKQEGQPKSIVQERVTSASRMLDLDQYLTRRPAELSGGQRQRVAIGRAIVRDPKLFLFDEPLSNLDAALRMNTRVEIAALHRTLSASMIYVTHDQIEAMTLADKIVVLRDGRIEQVGSPMELYNNPANRFVAGFLGSPSMNFLDRSVSGLAAGRTLGIRPEHLTLRADGQLSGEVTHVERLGGDTNLLVRTDQGETLTVRLFGQNATEVGSRISLGFDAAAAFYFDDADQRILPAAA